MAVETFVHLGMFLLVRVMFGFLLVVSMVAVVHFAAE